jgi:formate hydrogenlyase subunit 6/NADH:ubiquinone oxidoreductase subunit I
MYCNLCAEACPVNCLHLTREFSYIEGDVRALTIDLDGLLRPEPLSEYELRQRETAQLAPGDGEEG